MYDHRLRKILLRKQFKQRSWKREETFHQYIHEKVILTNQVPISEDDIIDYIIDGISLTSLRDQARIDMFTSKASLLQAFEKVTLRLQVSDAKRGDQPKRNDGDGGTQRQCGGEKFEKKSAAKGETERRCFNCELRNHMSVDCPMKSDGLKCFQCGERGHIAIKCEKFQKMRNICSDLNVDRKKYTKEVKLNGNKILALIDTGSDLYLLRSNIKLNLPQLNSKEIRFAASGKNSTLGEFKANVTIDGNEYLFLYASCRMCS